MGRVALSLTPQDSYPALPSSLSENISMRSITVRYELLRLAIRERIHFFDRPPSEGDEEGQKQRDKALADIERLTEEPIPIPGEDASVWLHKLRVSAYRLRRADRDDPITSENKADRKVLTKALATLRALLPPAGPVDPVGPIRGETIPHDAIREHVDITIIPWLLGCLNYNRKTIDAEQIQAQLKPIQLEEWIGIITTHLENEGFLIRLEPPPAPAVGTFNRDLVRSLLPRWHPPQRWAIAGKVVEYAQQRTREGQTPNLAHPPAEQQDSTTTDKRQAEVGQLRVEMAEEGPLPPDRFRMGNATVERLTSDQYWLLDALWHQPERTISLISLGKLYSDRKPGTDDPAEALRKLRGRVNNLLARSRIRLEIERVNDHYRIAPI